MSKLSVPVLVPAAEAVGLVAPQKKILSFSSLTLVALLPDILEHDSKPDRHGAQVARCYTASHTLEAT